MTITMLTTGTRGDTQPFVALGVALQDAGYPVRIAAAENFASFVTGYGLEFYPTRGDIARVATSAAAADARQADNPLKFMRSLRHKAFRQLLVDLQADFYAASAGAQAIVYHPGAAIGYFIAQQQQIPSILAAPFPMTPTREYPALLFYHWPRLGKWFNYLTHKIFTRGFWSVVSGPVKTFWQQQFGQLPAGFGPPYGQQTTRRRPTVISLSEHVFPRPDDWPAHVHSDGYWFLDAAPDWTPPDDLQAFLQAGDPPVYIGFGSVGDPQTKAETTALALDALQRTGRRGILASGWQGMAENPDIPGTVYLLESAPHSWLFPRMAVVVHHGGAGTTAAGLRAGVPSVIIPHGNDQFAWGRRVQELGVGPEPVPWKKLTAGKLAAAIQQALADDVVKTARDLGGWIRTEKGTTVARQVIIDSLAA